MTDQKTLITPQPTQEIKRNQVLGGVIGDIEESLETILRGPTVVNEGPVTGKDLEQVRRWEAIRPKLLGERSDFQTPRRREDIYPGLKTQLERQLYQEHVKTIMSLPIEEKRMKINELNELQPHYRGSVDSQGNVTIYHEANAERKQAENLARQIHSERAQKLAQATSRKTAPKAAVSGTVDLNQEKIFEAGTILSPITATG